MSKKNNSSIADLEKEITKLQKNRDKIQEESEAKIKKLQSEITKLKNEIFDKKYGNLNFNEGDYFIEFKNSSFYHGDIFTIYKIISVNKLKVSKCISFKFIRDDNEYYTLIKNETLFVQSIKKDNLLQISKELSEEFISAALNLDYSKVVDIYNNNKNIFN